MAHEPNYITPAGYKRLVDELEQLLKVERPKLVNEVADAAAQGDRSENAEYLYGKRRLRQIDSRLRFLNARLERAQVVDPTAQKGDRVLFGAQVTVEDEDGEEAVYQIVGVDEVDPKAGKISYQSPLGKALMHRRAGDAVAVQRPSGAAELTVVHIRYR